uniref:Cyclic nucleotide-binding domain-containing protein n=1 Tax=Ditylenchus dipsaci TaxID=166011 RepID=A0A915CUW2_9BILA
MRQMEATQSVYPEVRKYLHGCPIIVRRTACIRNDLRRRTSQVREEVVREPTPEKETDAPERAPSGIEREQASLMSLIGLHQVQMSGESQSVKKSFIPKTIDPFGRTYMFWLAFVVVAFLYNSFTIPLRSSYPYQTDENDFYWMFVDYTFDLFWSTYRERCHAKTLSEEQSVQARPTVLATPGHFLPAYWTCSCWRIARTLKLLSFWEFFDLLDSSFSIHIIAKTFSYMIYIIHCNSCVYYMLSAWQAFGKAYMHNGKWYLNKWVYNNQGNAYIRCFYFTAAVATSTGNNPAPTNVIEYIYMTFSWMMGVFVFALLLGQIRDIVSNAKKQRGISKHHGQGARVRAWFLYTWEQQKTLEEKNAVIPGCGQSIAEDLVLKLRPVIFLPGDMICRKGDVGKEMYIVNNGILEVGGDHNEIVFATLTEDLCLVKSGSLLAIGGNNRRTANIRSKGFSTLFVLSKEDLNLTDASKDVNKAAPNPEEAKKELTAKCRVSSDIRTPRMLEAVAKLLPPQSNAKKELNNAIRRPSVSLKKLKRWSTIPDDYSDVSDMELENLDLNSPVPNNTATMAKAQSLDM